MIFDVYETDEKFYIVFKQLVNDGYETKLSICTSLHRVFFSYFEDLIGALFTQGYNFIIGEDFSIYTEEKKEAQKIVDWLESLKLMIEMEAL